MRSAPSWLRRWSTTPAANCPTTSKSRSLGSVGIAGVDVDDAEARLDDHLLGQVGIPAPDVRRGVDAGLGEGRGRARARRRSSRRCHPHPAGSGATSAWRAWPTAARSDQRLPRAGIPNASCARRLRRRAARGRLGAEALVDPQQRLLLLGRSGTGRGGRRRPRSRRRPDPDRGCRPARRATRPRSGAPWRSAGGCRPTACAGPVRSGSGRGWRRRPARPGGARRCGRPHAGCG